MRDNKPWEKAEWLMKYIRQEMPNSKLVWVVSAPRHRLTCGQRRAGAVPLWFIDRAAARLLAYPGRLPLVLLSAVVPSLVVPVC